jgi:hypothetical protein
MGALWIDIGRFSLTSIPYAIPVEASRQDIEHLLNRSNRLAAVFPTRHPTGIQSHAFSVRDRDFGLGRLQRQFRQHVRRGATACVVRPLAWQDLRRLGHTCSIETMDRQGNRGGILAGSTGWNHFCAIASQTPGLNAFGCFRGDELLAFVVAWSQGEECEAIVMHRAKRSESVRASHVLVYEFTRSMCRRPGVRCVSMGREWLPPRPSLSQFKRHAGYEAEPIHIGVVLHPSVRSSLEHVATRTILRGLRTLTYGRSAMFDNLELLDAAALTHLPHLAAGRR